MDKKFLNVCRILKTNNLKYTRCDKSKAKSWNNYFMAPFILLKII